jgi:uncharacterized damage-inducible protein DinB
MDPRLIGLAEILRLNTRLYRNCLANLSDQDARERPAGKGPTNSAAFVAAHLVDSRHYLLGLLGKDSPSPLKGADGGFNDISKVSSYPALSEIRTAWNAAGDALDRQLNAATAAQLDTPFKDFPVETPTLLGVLAFMVQHESYHLGQLGLLRKHAGLEAMAYS